MARLAFTLRRPRRPEPSAAHARRGERGATLTEYGLLVALVVVAALGGIGQLQDESGSYLVETGSDVGQPRELAADMSADLPDEPAWLPQPPAPTTTTTAPTTTTTVATTASTTATTAASTTSTTAATTTSTTAATTTTTTATTTSTTAATYPVGAVIYDGPMRSQRHTSDCYQIESPGQLNSSTERVSCNGGNNQKIQAVGTATQVAIRWKSVSTGHCLQENNNTVWMKACASGNNQLFTVTVDGSGWITFKSKSNNQCLAEYSSGLELETCSSSSDRQKFKFS